MGADIGYLQTKIRELQDKNEELEKKINGSLEREKRLNDSVSNILSKAKEKEMRLIEELVVNCINKTYEKEFKKIFIKQKEDFSQDIILNAKGFNHSVDSILKEVAFLRRDNTFMINLLVTKLGINPEELEEWCRKFDKEYPSKQVEEDLKKFKMKFYKERNKAKEIIEGKLINEDRVS